jgi:Mn2+/Fe2+ NRAMP family transporter
MASENKPKNDFDGIAAAPKGLALIWMIGPAFVWCGEFIGSGEVILATRLGGVLGTSILWAPALAIILKCWIGMGGARYTVCTGEGMIDMFSRIPGPKNWAVWIVLVAQALGAAVSIGVLSKAAGLFAASLVPLPPFACSWILTLAAVFLVWSGRFEYLKRSMTILVTVVIIGVGYVAFRTVPALSEILRGLFLFNVPPIPDWAVGKAGPSAWHEIIPLMGWAAGGFASQVWYTYWVLGAGYGMAQGRSCGEPADEAKLKRMTVGAAKNVLGWCRMVYVDASTALIIGMALTMAFMLAGAGILHPRHLVPESSQVATTLATIFGSQWGRLGEKL